jgi:peptide/nickel transport system permease protein
MPADYIDRNTAARVSQGLITQEQVEQMKHLYGIGDNSFWGILSNYFTWLGNLLKGDLGISFVYGKPVAEVIGRYMWISFGISFTALIFEIIISIPLGIYAATNQYGVADYTVTVLAMMGISLPSFFLGALLIRVFSLELGWFPMTGLRDATKILTGFPAFLDLLHHLVLPMVTLVVLSIGSLMRYTRTNMLEVLNSDYIRTARAKGLSEKTVIYKHAFRNTLIPLVTMLGGIIPSLFGGAMITESVFALEGIGYTAYNAVLQADVPFVMGYNMFLAVLTVLGILISDLLYAVVDPRVKVGG